MDGSDRLTKEAEEYEYGVQYYEPQHHKTWRMASTNHFNGWYPSEKSAKNALAQLRATRWGYASSYEYRMVRRPVGEVEVIDG